MKTLVWLVVSAILVISCGKQDEELKNYDEAIGSNRQLVASTSVNTSSYPTTSTTTYSTSTISYPAYPAPSPSPMPEYPYPDEEIAAGWFSCSVQNGSCLNGKGGSTCKKADGSYGLCSFSRSVCGCN